MNKPINKEYLISTLKSFESEILNPKYVNSEQLQNLKKDIEETINSLETGGKNVQVAKIEPIIGGNRVTFSYTLDDGTSKTSYMDVMNGEKGTSIVGADIINNDTLILNLSDGKTITAGQITVDPSKLSLDGYYTAEQIDGKFVQKLELNTLIQNYFEETFQPIELEYIKKLFS